MRYMDCVPSLAKVLQKTEISNTVQGVLWIPPPHSSAFPCCWIEMLLISNLRPLCSQLTMNFTWKQPWDAVFLPVLHRHAACVCRRGSPDHEQDWNTTSPRVGAHFYEISAANSLTSPCDSCCHLIEFRDSSFIPVYCQHNRWQADETSPKN